MKLTRLLLLLVLISIPILFFSCQKTTTLGKNVLPPSATINAISTDTLTVLAQEELELPVPTNSLSNYLLGSMKDPFFGTSYAGIFTQVQLGAYGFNFDSIRIDSVVLSLPFYAAVPYYGIQNIPQTIKVYQVTQNMLPATTYYSNQTFSYNPVPIGVRSNFVPNVASFALDSPTILGTKQYPQLRIRMTNAFIQELISQSANGALLNNSTFQYFLKGIFIAPDTSGGFGGGIMYFNMSGANIFVYGKQGKVASEVDSSIQLVNFPVNSSAVVATGYYKHNYNGTPVQALLNSNASNDSTLYLQSMQGLRAKITIPYLKNLGKILINKAELEVTQDYQLNIPLVDTDFSGPGSVEVLTDSSNNDYSIEDFNNQFLTYGGTFVKTLVPGTSDSIEEYSVSIADQLQYMLTGNPTGSTINYSKFTSLFLLTFPNPEIANRIIVGGGNAKKSKLVLHLIYTKLN